MRRIHRLAFAGLLLFSAAASGQGPRLAVLDAILPGAWQLHEIGAPPGGRAICVRDPGLLLQVQHGSVQCARFVLEDGARSATIHYTCPGQGNGRTSISVENGGLLRLKTQGIAGGAPFDYDYEVRRVGACADFR
jgi:hypothetical protein